MGKLEQGTLACMMGIQACMRVEGKPVCRELGMMVCNLVLDTPACKVMLDSLMVCSPVRQPQQPIRRK